MEEVQEKDQAGHTPEPQEAAPLEDQTATVVDAAELATISDEEPLTEADFDSQDVLIAEAVSEPAAPGEDNYAAVKAVIEAAIYITDEPLSAEQIAAAIQQPLDHVKDILAQLVAEYSAPDRGLSLREIQM